MLPMQLHWGSSDNGNEGSKAMHMKTIAKSKYIYMYSTSFWGCLNIQSREKMMYFV
jgi:hypothetical protein